MSDSFVRKQRRQHRQSYSPHLMGIKIRHFDKVYPVESAPFPLQYNTFVVVETTRGIECGQVKYRSRLPRKHRIDIRINRVIRAATEEDIAKMRSLESKEQRTFGICMDHIEKYNIPIRAVSVEYIFDESKCIVHFKTNEENEKASRKPNIGKLVTDLSQELNVRVEMRQVGPRGEAKLIGGVGNCGRNLCCSNWLSKSNPITIKMAKAQGLPINIPKLSGVCGRLMCCLQYERDNYENGALVKSSEEVKVLEEVFDKEEGGTE